MNTCPCFMCVFLLRDTLFNRRGWFINIELTANTVTHNTVTHSIVTHAWTELIQHTCVSGRHILAFLCLGMAVGTLALLYFKQQSPQWKTLKYKKCYICGPTERTSFTVLSYNKKADMSPSWASIGNKQLRHFIAWCVLMSILMRRYDRERTVALTLVFTGKFCG